MILFYSVLFLSCRTFAEHVDRGSLAVWPTFHDGIPYSNIVALTSLPTETASFNFEPTTSTTTTTVTIMSTRRTTLTESFNTKNTWSFVNTAPVNNASISMHNNSKQTQPIYATGVGTRCPLQSGCLRVNATGSPFCFRGNGSASAGPMRVNGTAGSLGPSAHVGPTTHSLTSYGGLRATPPNRTSIYPPIPTGGANNIEHNLKLIMLTSMVMAVMSYCQS